MGPQVHSLVLYKGQPALVTATGKKIAIRLADGSTVDVRPKDIETLHPGPLANLSGLHVKTRGDIQTAWELLAGGETTLPELSELIFGEFTPQTAWATWELVADERLFSGTPEAIAVHDPDIVASIDARREAKAAEAAAWQDFLAHLENGVLGAELDQSSVEYLAEVERVALGHSKHSRVLQAFGHAETPQSAHSFLLSIGYWSPARNPYPARAGLPEQRPAGTAPALPAEDRLDLTEIVALAIDDAGSSDPDDAISFHEGYLWVHIADAAALVPAGSPLDEEARSRAANLYLPEGTIRMLPEAVTDQLGLGLQEVSPAMSFKLSVDEDGQATLESIAPSWLRVERLTYEEAETLLDESPFQEIRRICARHEALRLQNGAVEIELPEVKVKADETGLVTIRPLPPLKSRDLVREAMLIAGEAVGRFAQDRDLALPYTVQPPPREEEIDAEGLAGMYARLRTMQRSEQRTTPGPHSGLGLEIYVQVTSPLRRYLDLVAHQQLRRYLGGQEPFSSADIVAAIGATDEIASSVRWAERQSNAHWKMNYLMQHEDWQGSGVVIEQRGRREQILIPELDLETWLNAGKHGLNAEVNLAVTGVDIPNLSATFRRLS